MFENIGSFFKKIIKNEPKELLIDSATTQSKDAAKERLHLVLMQDRANVSADFLELMKQEMIDVIKKYIVIDESQIDVRLTNQENIDGTMGAPSLYANIPILNIRNDIKCEVFREEDDTVIEENVNSEVLLVDENIEKAEEIVETSEIVEVVESEAEIIAQEEIQSEVIVEEKEVEQEKTIVEEENKEVNVEINQSEDIENEPEAKEDIEIEEMEQDEEDIKVDVEEPDDDDDDDVTFDDLLKAAEEEKKLSENENIDTVIEKDNEQLENIDKNDKKFNSYKAKVTKKTTKKKSSRTRKGKK